MPTYEYRCLNGHDFEDFVLKISDGKPHTPCPTCGERGERQLSAGGGLLFKGSGFYITDYGKDGKKSLRAGPGERVKAEGSKADGGSSESAPSASSATDSTRSESAKSEGAKGEAGKADIAKPDAPTTGSGKADGAKAERSPSAPVSPKSDTA